MKKTLSILLLSWLILGHTYADQNDPFPVRGKVLDSSGLFSLPGVNVLIKGSTSGTVTDVEGDFELMLPRGSYTLTFSYIGYSSKEMDLSVPLDKPLEVVLEEEEISLASVEVVSTGFQELSSERSAGSFVQVDNELINRRVSTTILDRLEDVAPGVLFGRDATNRSPSENISIRGRSTLLYDNQPLIVVDNLAYDGPIENINPNDVESITILRDATAASIWGARAGNGVIVIKTKQGNFQTPFRVSINSNLTIGESFDPYYAPKMAIGDFVAVEERLFGSGYYNSRYNSYNKLALSPWVEDMFANRNGMLSEEELALRRQYYGQTDVREDLAANFYRKTLNQQYAINLSGGTDGYAYLFSVGYDHNRASEETRRNSRITLNAKQDWKILKDRLNLSLGSYLVQSSYNDGFANISNLAPYDDLVDSQGNALPIIQDHNIRFKDEAMEKGALDWSYRPYEELGMSPESTIQTDVRLNLSADYKLWKGLDAKLNYQYWQSNNHRERQYPESAYFSRNLINLYTEFIESGTFQRNIPLGGIYDYSNTRSYSHNLRGQLNYSEKWNSIHELNVLAGFEVKDLQSNGTGNRFYGFDFDTGIPTPVNYQVLYPELNTGFTGYIPFEGSNTGSITRFRSFFANAGYTFRQKYLFNASIRSDASNLFGVYANLRRVPLWSAGAGWILSEENWMDLDWLDYLKLKTSFGYNGNTNPTATAFTTAVQFDASLNPWVNRPWLAIQNPPNPQARWEKIKILNAGFEFEILRGKFLGSVEGYKKEGLDLFGAQPYFPSSGNTTVTRNYANTRTYGLDAQVTAKILDGEFYWNAIAFHSFFREKVTRYDEEPIVRNVVSYGGGGVFAIPTPVEGKPLQYIFSYPFAGLDPQTGEPRGYLDGEPSTNYSAILNQMTVDDLVYHGSAIPTSFGSLRNQFGWKGFELSVNVTYRLGYYFKRETIDYSSLNRGTFQHADYGLRWKQPGDELHTFIGSDPERVNNTRTRFELDHSGHVRRGDHIRLQDIRLSYDFGQGRFQRLPFRNFRIYSYFNNLGLLWKAAKDVRDPDYRNYQVPRTYSIGLSANF